MKPDWQRDGHELYCGDSLAVMKELPDNHVETIITDPPAGIGFMGKSWDSDKGGRDKWIAWLAERLQEGLRVTKPGGALLCWAIPRTSHWTGFAVEEAGWRIFDRLAHLFGSGFPKSTDLSKKLDKAAGAEREVVGKNSNVAGRVDGGIWGDGIERPWKDKVRSGEYDNTIITAPATPAAQLWDGWGTALKPACEDWWFAHKPMTGATSDELYALTGWDWWHSDQAITNTPANRLKAYKRHGVRLPSGHYEVELCSIRRKALHAGVETDLLFCQRATVPARHKPPWSLVARVDVKAYRKWTACNGAANALEHGVVGLWIDGTRVGIGGDADAKHRASAWSNHEQSRTFHGGKYRDLSEVMPPSGRWPANLILSHHESCVQRGVKRVKGSHPGNAAADCEAVSKFGNKCQAGKRDFYNDADGLETVEDWDCVNGWRLIPPPPCPDCKAKQPPSEGFTVGRDVEHRWGDIVDFDGYEEKCVNCGERYDIELPREVCPVRLLGEQSGERPSCSHASTAKPKSKYRPGQGNYQPQGTIYPGDTGTAARFFYCAKASKRERNAGRRDVFVLRDGVPSSVEEEARRLLGIK